MAKRMAQITAAAVNVLCPYCWEPQPDPDAGSDMWTPDQVAQSRGAKSCVSCDKGFLLEPQSTARVEPVGARS